MNTHRHSLMKRRVGAVLAAVMASAGLTSALVSPVSAATEATVTDVSVTVATAFGANKVTSTLAVYDTVAVVSREPQVTGTFADAEKLNATRPTLTCKVGLGTAAERTITTTGDYVSHNTVISLAFAFSASVPSTVDTCTLSTSTFVKASGNMDYPLSAAGRAALWGDPAVVLKKTQDRLKAIAPKVRSVFNGKWGTDYTKRISGAVRNYKFVAVSSRFDASSTSTKTMYIVRLQNHPTNWINICQRLLDARLVCMRFNPVTNKSTFTASNTSSNYYTTPLTTEVAS